jgi:TATA-binding protein-associated factor
LILHRKVCNHPVFVLEHLEGDSNIKKHKDKMTQKEICAFSNSGKLSGLVDLLFECEIIDSKKFEESKKEESKSNKQSHKDERSDLMG